MKQLTPDAPDDRLRAALREMPVPAPRRGFVDDALARAAVGYEHAPQQLSVRRFARWQTWSAAAGGAAVAAIAMFLFMRPQPHTESGITLAVDELRTVDVLIDSERTLDAALIRVVTTGPVELDGFDDKHTVEWQTRLDRGRNVLSVPVVARGSGSAQLIAVIEHAGKTRRVAVNLLVKAPHREVA